MKVGIIVYSQTGNTYLAAQKVKDKLTEAGHEAEIERITITGRITPGSKDFQFDTLPDAALYEALIFAAPVQAFSLSPAMTAYLSRLSTLKEKKIACFVTKRLPGKWTGGSRAVARMKKICQEKGGNICDSEIIIWNGQREQAIAGWAERLSRIF